MSGPNVRTIDFATRTKDLAAGSEPPDNSGMEARLTAVEQRLDKVEVKLDRLDDRLRVVEGKLAEVGGKLDLLTAHIVGKIPSWWQVPSVIGATIIVIGTLALFAKYLSTHGFLG